MLLVAVNAPATVVVPKLNAPWLTTVKSLPTLTVPNVKALTSVIVTAFAPLLVSDTAPVKLLLEPFVVKSIVAAPALKLDVPVINKVPVWLIAPVLLVAVNAPATVVVPKLNAPWLTIVKSLPTLTVPNVKALTSLIVTAFAPLLVSDTTPVKLLLEPLVLKSIVAAPALKLEVPVINKVPV